jgi:tetratricopeptide (TPR) repeat protein
MSRDAALEQFYSLRQLQSLLGVSRRILTGLVEAGFITPTRGSRNEMRFSFRDAVLLRTAYRLQDARIPARKILSSLARLRRDLPVELPLTGFRIVAAGDAIAVREGDVQWETETGQMLLDFEVATVAGEVSFFDRSPATHKEASHQAADWLAHADEVHASDPAEAERAYLRSIALEPAGHVEAYVNLGVLLCDTQRCGEALRIFDAAIERFPSDPLLRFNQAVVMEELGDVEGAMRAYEACLERDGNYADAHFNLARIYEQKHDEQSALRHFSAYRRSVRQ